jgi:hypothetical protein
MPWHRQRAAVVAPACKFTFSDPNDFVMSLHLMGMPRYESETPKTGPGHIKPDRRDDRYFYRRRTRLAFSKFESYQAASASL